MEYKEEVELQKQIYEHSIRQLSQLNDSKKHLEGKCMNILQASSILVTLFVGLMQYLNNINLKKPFNCFYTILTVIFYIMIVLSIITIIFSLNDKIENLRILLSKKYKKIYKVLKGLKIIEENDVAKNLPYARLDEEGRYMCLPEISDIKKYLENTSVKQYYQSLILSYENAIKSLDAILLTKNSLFLSSLKTFVVAILVLIIMGILIA